MLFFHILLDVIAPVFTLIVTGYLFEKKFHFDLRVLSKVLLYLVMPATIITTLSTSTLSGAHIRTTALFCLAMLVGLFVVSTAVSRLLGHGRGLSRAFNLSVMFYNSGNFGFPVSNLAFPGLGLAVQVIVLAVQNLVNFSFGVLLVSSGRYPLSQALRKTLQIPLVYAVGIAWLIRHFNVRIPDPIWVPLQYLSQALIPMALLTLGFQLAKTPLRQGITSSISSVLCRLFLAPLLAFGVVKVVGIGNPLASILVVTTCYPTAVNTALIALELDNEPEFAANAVFLSTIWSALSVALVIYLVRVYGV